MIKQQFLTVTLILVCFNIFSQSTAQIDSTEITNLLFQHANDDSPGMAVGIVKDGKIVFESYIGYANLEHQIKIDQNSRFNIASNAKQYTALCILNLINNGKIGLHDDFRVYLPELYPQIGEKITVAHLLTHTSGIRDIYDLWALQGKTWWKLFIDNDDAIDLLKNQTDLNFKPGTEYLYSNSNYILLTEIIKEATGKEFSEVAKSMFLEMDMTSTDFLVNHMQVIPQKARPYGNWNGWKEYPLITELHGDGFLFTTLRDQLKWEQIIQQNDGSHFTKLFVESSQVPVESAPFENYGYGLMFGSHKDINYSYHDGNTGAYNATFLRFPENNISIVVISNNSNVPTNYLAKQIIDVILDLKPTLHPAGPDKIEKLKSPKDITGAYKNDEGGIILITQKDGFVFREIYQREPVKLIHENGGLFEYETVKDLKINFTNIGKPNQNFTIYKSTQRPRTYYRLPDSDFISSDEKEIEGSYFNAETNTRMILSHQEGKSYVLNKNGKERNAQMILNDFLKMNSYEIQIIRDEDNQVTGLNVKNIRIKKVIFNKE